MVESTAQCTATVSVAELVDRDTGSMVSPSKCCIWEDKVYSAMGEEGLTVKSLKFNVYLCTSKYGTLLSF